MSHVVEVRTASATLDASAGAQGDVVLIVREIAGGERLITFGRLVPDRGTLVVRFAATADVRPGDDVRPLPEGRLPLPGDRRAGIPRTSTEPPRPRGAELSVEVGALTGPRLAVEGRLAATWRFAAPWAVGAEVWPLGWDASGAPETPSFGWAAANLRLGYDPPLGAVGLLGGISKRTIDAVDVDTRGAELGVWGRFGPADGPSLSGSLSRILLAPVPAVPAELPLFADTVPGRATAVARFPAGPRLSVGGRAEWSDASGLSAGPFVDAWLSRHDPSGDWQLRFGLAYERVHGHPDGDYTNHYGVGASLGVTWRAPHAVPPP